MSTLILLVFLTVIATSVSTVVKHQIHQYRQTAYSYEAKSMIEMSEVILKESGNINERYPERLVFSSGKVTVSKIGPATFQLEAVLNNQYSSTKVVDIMESKQGLSKTEE